MFENDESLTKKKFTVEVKSYRIKVWYRSLVVKAEYSQPRGRGFEFRHQKLDTCKGRKVKK